MPTIPTINFNDFFPGAEEPVPEAPPAIEDIVAPPPAYEYGGFVNPYLLGKTKVKVPKAYSKEPPLELNVAAKQAMPWDKITTHSEFVLARADGRFLGYAEDPYTNLIEPCRAAVIHSVGNIKKMMAIGLWAHKHRRVCVFSPVLSPNGKEVFIWKGRNREEFDFALKNGVFKLISGHQFLETVFVEKDQTMEGLYV